MASKKKNKNTHLYAVTPTKDQFVTAFFEVMMSPDIEDARRALWWLYENTATDFQYNETVRKIKQFRQDWWRIIDSDPEEEEQSALDQPS